jgi:ATP-dependent Clp protease protease subunit
MVFLMQYLDDELCNQICGLLINIHMEDRSKELEKKEMEKSGLFKAPVKQKKTEGSLQANSQMSSAKDLSKFAASGQSRVSARPQKLIEDLMISEQDLKIDENYSLERYTLQKMTLEWLNWNAQFFDYSEEPYIFYLAEILSKDFSGQENEGRLYYESSDLRENQISNVSDKIATISENFKTQNSTFSKSNGMGLNFDLSSLMIMFKNMAYSGGSPSLENFDPQLFDVDLDYLKHFDVYSPFRLLANLVFPDPNIGQDIFHFESPKKIQLSQKLKDLQKHKKQFQTLTPEMNFQSSLFDNVQKTFLQNNPSHTSPYHTHTPFEVTGVKDKQSLELCTSNLITDLSQKNFFDELHQPEKQMNFAEKAFTQKQLRREYKKTALFPSLKNGEATKSGTFMSGIDRQIIKPATYLKGGNLPSEESYMEFRDYYRKQTESALQEEEAKKVFMIINSFGGSVGNGITVHDALQFIKAGSLTLALGVAASAASLALAGGTIGERYVTEGCHVMIHQPEGGLSGQASDIWIDSQEIMKIRLDVAEIYSLSTYRPRHKILRDLDRDFYLTATETIFYGLADEIATNEVMHEIISMTSAVWDYHDSQQQRLLETRESATAGADTQTQN